MTERKLTKQVKQYLKSLSGCWFYHPGDRWIVGLPDFIICYKGKFIAIELKREGKFLTKIQEYVMRKIEGAGGKIKVAYNIEDVKKILERGE